MDWTGTTLWLSSEIGPTPNWAVEITTNCVIVNSFNPPYVSGPNGGTSGIAFDGNRLWHVRPLDLSNPGLHFQTDLTGVQQAGPQFVGLMNDEDLACDQVTFAPKIALWGNEASLGSNRLTAYEVPSCGAGVTSNGVTVPILAPWAAVLLATALLGLGAGTAKRRSVAGS